MKDNIIELSFKNNISDQKLKNYIKDKSSFSGWMKDTLREKMEKEINQNNISFNPTNSFPVFQDFN